jgi:hypothetical protein
VARILALVSICFALYGCELIADFDRGKIPVKDSGTAQPEPSKDAGNPPAEEDAGGEEDAGK